MKKIFFLIGVILLSMCNAMQAQDIPETECTISHERAYWSMKFFLTYNLDNLKQHRLESGTNNIPLSQVSHVDDPIACARLNSIINSVPKYVRIKNAYAERNHTMFFYQTNDFYYIFWRYVNQSDVKITSPKEIFIIVNKESESIFACDI